MATVAGEVNGGDTLFLTEDKKTQEAEEDGDGVEGTRRAAYLLLFRSVS